LTNNPGFTHPFLGELLGDAEVAAHLSAV